MEEDAVEPMTYFQEKLKNIVQQKINKKRLAFRIDSIEIYLQLINMLY